MGIPELIEAATQGRNPTYVETIVGETVHGHSTPTTRKHRICHTQPGITRDREFRTQPTSGKEQANTKRHDHGIASSTYRIPQSYETRRMRIM